MSGTNGPPLSPSPRNFAGKGISIRFPSNLAGIRVRIGVVEYVSALVLQVVERKDMKKLLARTLILAFAALSTASMAQLITLSNGGSVAKINIGANSADGFDGLNDWRIAGGPNNVVQEVFGVKFVGAAFQDFNQLSAPTFSQPTADLLNVSYTSGNVDYATRYLLTGGAPNSADLSEVVTITNRNQTAISFSLFEYDFFSPGGNTGGTGTLLNSSTIRHANSGGYVTVGATNIPDRWMIDTTANVANAIFAGNLSNGSSPFNNAADLAFAFQWNVVINPGQTWQMSKDKLLAVPEPSTLIAFAGLAGIAVFRRRSKTS